MKKKIISYLIIALISLLVIPTAITSFGFICPAQFDESYYGELPYMFNRLKNGKEGKIVFVGNSAIAFGVHKPIIEKELRREVVCFGLYGAIGTKAMIDLSKVGIKKGDLIVLAPELNKQGMSLYFSSENMWMGIDGHYDMLPYISNADKKSMIGNYPDFAAKKFEYFIKGKKPNAEGVYTQNSFDVDNQEVGYMTYDRPYNIMINGCDQNSLIKYDNSYLGDDFVDYLNEYAKYVQSKNASLYFGFTPTNNRSVVSSGDEIDEFYNALKNKLKFPIMGHPLKYQFDYEWFYDNNSHLNSSGMSIYSYQLVEDLKIALEDDSITNIDIPEKPVIPVPDYSDGDNSDVDCFTYEEMDNCYKITALNEKGKQKNRLIIPATYENKPVIMFDNNVFKDNDTINEIIVSKNIRSLLDNSFTNAKNLTHLILEHDNPNDVNVGMSLLEGADNCYVYVKEAYYDIFATHYNWGYYRHKLKKY